MTLSTAQLIEYRTNRAHGHTASVALWLIRVCRDAKWHIREALNDQRLNADGVTDYRYWRAQGETATYALDAARNPLPF